MSCLVAAALTGGVLFALTGPVHGVAPNAAPSLVSPGVGSTVGGNPILQWSPVPGAAKYRVQVSVSPTFSSFVYAVDTTNVRATPISQLPLGTLHWRVAGTDGGSGIGPFAVGSFVKEFSTAPQLVSPHDTAELTYPDDAPRFSWAPLAGAATYRLEIDNADDFVSAAAYTTPNTSFTLTTPQTVNQPFFWRVRGESAAVVSDYSTTRSYSFAWPQSADPDLVHPAPVAEGEALPVVEDVVFRWSPVRGAASYRLEVSGNGDWTNNMTLGFPVTVFGTSYSPAQTLPDGPYFWRVRANDTAATANAGPWSSPVGAFVKTWNEPVTLLSPEHGATLVDPPTLRWDPVQPGAVDDVGTEADESLSTQASYYRVEVSLDVNFSVGSVSTCVTYRTQWTPYRSTTVPTSPSACDIAFVDGNTYWWRVRAVDMPSGIQGGLSDKRSFTYGRGGVSPVQLLSPANGATVETPALSWTAIANVGRYEVEVSGSAGTKTFQTQSTSLTPTTKLAGALPGTYSWRVRPIDIDGIKGTATAFRSFVLQAPATPGLALLGPADGTHTSRMPAMSWAAHPGATKYRVFYAKNGIDIWFGYSDASALPYPSFTHTGGSVEVLSPGTYAWRVEALNDANVMLAESGSRSFVIDELAPAQLLTPANCTSLPCQALPDTPTFTWADVPHAAHYRVYVATDANFNNIVKQYTTEHHSLTPRESFADSNAGQSYYWFVRPCKTDQVCGPFEPPYTGRYAFEKRSVPVEVVSPAYGAVVDGPVTFRWADYLDTNRRVQPTPATQEARQYHLQVSQVADFVTLLDDVIVDQTTYTPHSKAYPEGPLYWRVQAIDASGNALTYSRAPNGSPTTHHLVVKDQAEVVQRDSEPGSLTLTWDAQPFAKAYDVEIYKFGDTSWSPANKLTASFSGPTKVAAWAPTKALEAGTYAWRVRRVDNGTNNVDDWSVGKTFDVASAPPVLVSPDAGDAATDDRMLFDWEPVPGAVTYRFESSAVSTFATTLESVMTVMTEYANTKLYPAGAIYWRVTPLNHEGKPIGPVATRSLRRVLEGDFFPLPPKRILDTRGSSPIAGGTYIDLDVLGVGGVPEQNVTAVVLNVTVTRPTASGFLTVWPAGQPRPNASNLNFTVGQTVPNLVKARVGEDGKVSIFNPAGFVDVLADVSGYYTDGVPLGGSTYTPLTPERLMDTRNKGGAIGGGQTRDLTVLGLGQVPASGVGALALNVTVTAPTSSGYLTVFPKAGSRPTASNLNFTRGLTVANMVVVQIPANGQISLFNSNGSTHVIVDVAGWYSSGTQGVGAHFVALTPERILDTRSTTPVTGGTGRTVKVTGVGGVPATGVKAVVLNVTAVKPTSSGYLTVYPGGTRPVASNLNFTAKRNVPNLVVVKVQSGTVTVFNSNGYTDVLFDVVGWFG